MTAIEKEPLLRAARHLDKLFAASAAESEDSHFLFSVHTYHMQFHMRIAEYGRSTRLLRAIEKEQVLVFNWLYDTAAHQRHLPTSFHLDLAKALCSGNIAEADKAMRSHIRYGLDHILKNLGPLEISKGWRLKHRP
jgi:DNA-binding GntR family transcriptional regulator